MNPVDCANSIPLAYAIGVAWGFLLGWFADKLWQILKKELGI